MRFLPMLFLLAWLPSAGLSDPTPAQGPADGVPLPGWTTEAKCLRVVDGDTIDVEVRRVIRIRLIDCWAPESKIDRRVAQAAQTAEKQAGVASRENLRKLAEGKDCVVHVPAHVEVAKVMTMNRLLGRVWVGEIDLSEAQVRGGFAETEKPERVR